MIVFKEGTYMMSSLFPDTDFSADGNAAFVIPDGSELATKVQMYGIVDFILDDNGNLIDVTPKPIPEEPVDPEEEIKNELQQIDLATIRPLRAILAEQYTQEDKDRIVELEAKATELRSRLSSVIAEKQIQGDVKE